MWRSQHVGTRLVVAHGIAMSVLSGMSPRAQDRQVETLKGIASVTVVVDPLAPAVEHIGVTPAAVANEVERVLRRLEVLVKATASDAQLTVTINAVEIKTRSGATSGIAYTVAVSVEQEATLRNSSQAAHVTTWRHAGIGVASVAKANDAIRGQLVEYLDALMAAYRSANRPAG